MQQEIIDYYNNYEIFHGFFINGELTLTRGSGRA